MVAITLSLPNVTTQNLSSNIVVNLDQGDPTVLEPYWRKMEDKCTVTISGHELMSYFSDRGNMCWFLEPELASSIRRVHGAVGNAVVDEDRFIVVGTGSTQLTQTVLYVLSSPFDGPEPVSVVCAAPYYSAYPSESDYLRSRLYKWGGDAHTFFKDGAYIEIVTSPNNPDGIMRKAVVKKKGGFVVHDLAYYWPQYTPITAPANHDIMLFTFSKCTGHAGSRIGWTLVKNKSVAARMIKFMVCNSIGVSRESQLSCQDPKTHLSQLHFGRNIMFKRWERLREVAKGSNMFNLPKYPTQYCQFIGEIAKSHTGFAWLESIEGRDLESVFREYKIVTRGGARFGCNSKYVRVSLLCKDPEFELINHLQQVPKK